MRKNLAVVVLRFSFAFTLICGAFATGPAPVALADAPSAAPAATGACDLWDDEQGIPHIRADNRETLFACFGYIHGRDRAWQLDYFRRTAQGRRAEVFGPDHVRSDFQMRILDLPSHAKRLYAGLTENDRRLWDSYARGVNRGIAAALEKGVFEFSRWSYSPEPWTAIDSLSLLLLQSFDQTRKTFSVQLEETRWIESHGDETAQLFLTGAPPWDVSVLKTGEFPAKSNPEDRPAPKAVSGSHPATPGSPDPITEPGPGEGSNNWVVSASRSKSRNPLLANDPHLGLGHPPLWHLANIESAGFNAIGAAMPGIPLIVSGANRDTAWGLTNSYLEVAHISFVPENDLADASEVRPWIWIKLWKIKVPYFFKTFRRTKSGFPVLPLDSPKGKAMVLTWTGFDLEASDLHGLFPLMAARSAREIDSALIQVGVPSWNFVFADIAGNIGYRAVGRIPKATRARPPGITDETLRALEERWKKKELLASTEMPHAFNPRRGFIVTANNRQWPSDAAFHGGFGYSAGFRAFRIEELLAREREHDPDSFSRIQCDVQSVSARFLVPLLLSRVQGAALTEPLRADEKNALGVLASWKNKDYQATLECEPCALFRQWVTRIFSELLIDDAALYARLQKLGAKDAAFTGVLVRTFRETVTQLAKNGKFPAWGEIHGNRFGHLADESLFPRTEILPTPGDDSSVNPGTSKWEADFFRHTSGASQRLIVKLSNPPEVRSVLAGPNHPTGDHDLNSPDSPWRQWRDCRMFRRNFPVAWDHVTANRLEFF